MSSPFHSIESALAHVATGGIVVVADDEHQTMAERAARRSL